MKPQTYWQIALIIVLILIGGYFGCDYIKLHYYQKGIQIGQIDIIQQQTINQEIFLFINQNNQTIPIKLKWSELCEENEN